MTHMKSKAFAILLRGSALVGIALTLHGCPPGGGGSSPSSLYNAAEKI